MKNIVFLSIVTAGLLFTGCGGGGSDSSTTETQSQEQVDTTPPVITTASPVIAFADINKTITLTANEPVTFSLVENTPLFDLNGSRLTFITPSFDLNGGNDYNVTVKATDKANNESEKTLTFKVTQKQENTSSKAIVSVGNKKLTRDSNALTVKDTQGLVWSDKSNDKNTMDYATAETYCQDMGQGWRLPYTAELLNVIDFTKGNHLNASLLEDEFTIANRDPRMSVAWTKKVNGQETLVHFITGTDAEETNATALHGVKCVKGDEPKEHTFTKKISYVIDETTGLKWTKVNPDNSFRRSIKDNNATQYCTEQSVDGGGWRLPTINELRSLMFNNSSVNTDIIPAAVPMVWSNTAYSNAPQNSPKNYVLDLTGAFKHIGYEDTDQIIYVTCVKAK